LERPRPKHTQLALRAHLHCSSGGLGLLLDLGLLLKGGELQFSFGSLLLVLGGSFVEYGLQGGLLGDLSGLLGDQGGLLGLVLVDLACNGAFNCSWNRGLLGLGDGGLHCRNRGALAGLLRGPASPKSESPRANETQDNRQNAK